MSIDGIHLSVVANKLSNLFVLNSGGLLLGTDTGEVYVFEESINLVIGARGNFTTGSLQGSIVLGGTNVGNSLLEKLA